MRLPHAPAWLCASTPPRVCIIVIPEAAAHFTCCLLFCLRTTSSFPSSIPPSDACSKNNMSAAVPAPVHQQVLQELPSIWMLESQSPAGSTTTFLVGSTFRDDLVSLYGAPAQVWLRLDVPHAGDGAASATINCSVAIFNKTATRLVSPLIELLTSPYVCDAVVLWC